MTTRLDRFRHQFNKCVRCGQCRSACPVFDEQKTENYAPRGRVFLTQLLQEKELTDYNKAGDALGACLLCESCSSQCPSGINVHHMVALSRSLVADKNPSGVKRFVFGNLWTNPSLLRTTFKLGWLYEHLGLRKLAAKINLLGLLPGNLNKAEKMLANFPKKPASANLPEVTPPKGDKKYRVGYFLGCGTDLLYPQVGLDAVEVLSYNGCEVVVPKALKCCGMPQLANGQLETAKDLLVANLELWEKQQVDVIVSDCASCTSNLTSELWAEVLEDSPYLKSWEKFKAKVKDITVFLTKDIQLNTGDLGQLPDTVVTYHDPCHLVRSQKITKEPRQLLQQIPGIILRELPGEPRCCGGAGTFSVYNYDLSMQILAKKAAAIAKTGAQMVATCCPTCTLQLAHGISQHHLEASVVHPVELLAKAYRAKASQSEIA
jgi:glycolate oxidase iron-sulfur subunit